MAPLLFTSNSGTHRTPPAADLAVDPESVAADQACVWAVSPFPHQLRSLS